MTAPHPTPCDCAQVAERWRLAWLSACRDRSKIRHDMWVMQTEADERWAERNGRILELADQRDLARDVAAALEAELAAIAIAGDGPPAAATKPYVRRRPDEPHEYAPGQWDAVDEEWWGNCFCGKVPKDPIHTPPAVCTVAEHMDAVTSAVPCICQRAVPHTFVYAHKRDYCGHQPDPRGPWCGRPEAEHAAGYGADMEANGASEKAHLIKLATHEYAPGVVAELGGARSEICVHGWPDRACGLPREHEIHPPTHLPLSEVIELAADLARRAATPPGTAP